MPTIHAATTSANVQSYFNPKPTTTAVPSVRICVCSQNGSRRNW